MGTNRKTFNDFRDTIHAASEYLKNIQRTGQNVALFEVLLAKLPDPNNSALFEDATILSTVRNHLCEHNEMAVIAMDWSLSWPLELPLSFAKPDKNSLRLLVCIKMPIGHRFETIYFVGIISTPIVKDYAILHVHCAGYIIT
jgi:hypothetical protein